MNKDTKKEEDQQYIPISESPKFEVAQKLLDKKEVAVENLPTLTLSQFTPDSEDEDDPRRQIPNGFFTRMVTIIDK